MITLAWLLGILIGFASIFTGIYTTEFAKDAMVENPKRCEFEVKNIKISTNSVLHISFLWHRN